MKGWHFSFSTPHDGSGLGNLALLQMLRMDWTPVPLDIDLEEPLLTLRRTSRDSGSIQVPYRVNGFGEVPIPLTQLMQRETPYRLHVELARGQLNQARHFLAEASLQGFAVSADHKERLQKATRIFGKSVRSEMDGEIDPLASEALQSALWLTEDLIVDQCVQVLNHADDSLAASSRLGCALDEGILADVAEGRFSAAFAHAYVGRPWDLLEAEQGDYHWESLDELVHWAVGKNVSITMGPIVDFSHGLPDWLQPWASDHETMLTLLIDRIESMMGRYRDCVSRWLVVHGVNSAEFVGLTESKMLWMTKRLIEAARSMDPGADLLVGVDQPWGDYVTRTRRVYCPATFIDTLLRAQTGMTGIALELAPGYGIGGSYCRTLDATAQLLSHFSEFALPLDVLLSFASQDPPKNAGGWHGGFNEATQAEWAEKAATICLAHGTVRHAVWNAWQDRPGMRFPASGLVSENGKPKPALAALQKLRSQYLR